MMSLDYFPERVKSMIVNMCLPLCKPCLVRKFLHNSAKMISYILIDEVHHAAADSYKRIIDYFTPDFMLGMTATPERTDGANICDVLPPPDRFAV